MPALELVGAAWLLFAFAFAARELGHRYRIRRIRRRARGRRGFIPVNRYRRHA